MKALLVRFVLEDAGQDLIEYALLAGAVSIAAATILGTLGTTLNTKYDSINTSVTSAS